MNNRHRVDVPILQQAFARRAGVRHAEKVIGADGISKTRVLAWLNIVGMGLAGDGMPESAAVELRSMGFDFRGLSTDALSQNVFDMDPRPAAQMAKLFPNVIVGFKSVQYDQPDWKNIDRIVEAGKLADRPVMIDFEHRFSQIPYEQLVSEKLRPGDISTHLYKPFQPILDKDGKVYPYLIEARKRGVMFDLGHSIGTFTFRVVVPAIKAGWLPDSLSTDLHVDDMNRAAISYDQPDVEDDGGRSVPERCDPHDNRQSGPRN